MTIYSEIVKQFLVKKIEDIKSTAKKADDSYLDGALSLFGYGRDKKVSTGKQGLADKLLYQIQYLPDTDNDLATSSALVKLIQDSRAAAALTSSGAGYDEGDYGPGMINAMTMVTDLYQKLASVGLLDIPHDEDPLNIFRFHMGRYFANKVLLASTGVSAVVDNPKVTAAHQVRSQKEQLILNTLKSCEANLDILDVKHRDYHVSRRGWVLEFIEKIRRGNEDIAKEHTIISKLSISVSFFSTVNLDVPRIGHGIGFLHVCLEEAFKEVSSIPRKRINAVVMEDAALIEEVELKPGSPRM